MTRGRSWLLLQRVPVKVDLALLLLRVWLGLTLFSLHG